ncbi:MAG: hypothetical protein AAFR94_08135 [Pseudomonadota bacterium]
MRNHVFITFGLVMAGIFTWRAIDALAEPGFGVADAYVLGGFALAAALIASGIRGLLRARNATGKDDDIS